MVANLQILGDLIFITPPLYYFEYFGALQYRKKNSILNKK